MLLEDAGQTEGAIQRKKLGQFCFEGIILRDNWTSHTFQMTSGAAFTMQSRAGTLRLKFWGLS
jgi:hypothetical protein